VRYPAVYQETILTRHRMWISVVTRIGGIIEIGISDKQFTSEMNNVHPTTRNTPVRSAYSTLFSTDTSFSSIRLSCHVISLPTCTIGADRPTRNNRNGSHRGGRRIRLGSPAVCKRSCIKLNPGTRPCCQIS
jgi:hypothetical protein